MRSIVMRFALLVLALTACSGISNSVSADVAPGHSAIIGVEGQRVAFTNTGTVSLRLLRRAASGEPVGTGSLKPGEMWRGASDRLRTIEVINSSGGPGRFRVTVDGETADGRSRAVLLGDKKL